MMNYILLSEKIIFNFNNMLAGRNPQGADPPHLPPFLYV